MLLQSAPAYAANGQAPWQIASGVIYPEDITDDSPYLFSEIPGRFTGSYSGFNEDPLFVTVSPLLSILQQCSCISHDAAIQQCAEGCFSGDQAAALCTLSCCLWCFA